MGWKDRGMGEKDWGYRMIGGNKIEEDRKMEGEREEVEKMGSENTEAERIESLGRGRLARRGLRVHDRRCWTVSGHRHPQTRRGPCADG